VVADSENEIRNIAGNISIEFQILKWESLSVRVY
jgi:hypothetical protein